MLASRMGGDCINRCKWMREIIKVLFICLRRPTSREAECHIQWQLLLHNLLATWFGENIQLLLCGVVAERRETSSQVFLWKGEPLWNYNLGGWYISLSLSLSLLMNSLDYILRVRDGKKPWKTKHIITIQLYLCTSFFVFISLHTDLWLPTNWTTLIVNSWIRTSAALREIHVHPPHTARQGHV